MTQINPCHLRNPRRFLEDVLQSELHNPRILRGRYLTEDVAVENRRRIIHVETVCKVECFRSEFEPL